MIEPIPPLPLVPDAEGNLCLLIDNSALEHYMECGRKFEYSFIRKRVSASSAAPLNFGTAIHIALKHRFMSYGTLNEEELTKIEHDLIDTHFDANPQPVAEYRTPTLAKNLIEEYNSVYKKENFKVVSKNGKPLVEVSFAHDLGWVEIPGICKVKIVFMGRIDIVVEDAMGIWVVDHKTAFQFGKGFWNGQRMSFQCKGYAWAYMKSFGEKPTGYGIDAIRTRKPTKEDQFQSVTGVRRDDLARDFFLVSDEMLQEWKQNILSLCQELVNSHHQGFFPRRVKACQGIYGACAYCEVCALPEASRLPLLTSGEFVDNNWSPLNKPEQE